MTDRYDQLLEDELDAGFNRLDAHPRPMAARYRSSPKPSWSKKTMSLFAGLPAILTTKAVAAAAGITLASAAAGGAVVAVQHRGSAPPAPAQSASTTGSANGHAANASPDGTHGKAVTGAVSSCTPGPTFGQCVAAVASGGRSDGSGKPSTLPPPAANHPTGQSSSTGAVGPPSPLPTAPVSHPTGQPSSPGAVGPPSPLPTAPVSHPGGRP
jgi:hypothetical protein